MKITYHAEKAELLLNNLAELTGVRLSLLDTNYAVIASSRAVNPFCRCLQSSPSAKAQCGRSDAALLARCRESGNLEEHLCHAGLYDFAMPLKKEGVTAGFLIFGQIRSTLSPADSPDASLSEAYTATPFYPPEKIACLKRLLPLILFDEVIAVRYDDYFDTIARYVTAHATENLSLPFLCRHFHVSKNYLYQSFRQTYNTTVHGFITAARLRLAQKLLTETDKPVYEIAEAVGLPNYTYFCRLFKKHTSLTPHSFRRSPQ